MFYYKMTFCNFIYSIIFEINDFRYGRNHLTLIKLFLFKVLLELDTNLQSIHFLLLNFMQVNYFAVRFLNYGLFNKINIKMFLLVEVVVLVV